MSEPKNTLTRRQAEEALARGEHVAVAGRHVTHKRDLPPRPEGAEGDPGADGLEAGVVRGADGKLTHAGMRHAIQHGGSVLHQGEVITRLEDLPTPAQLARGNEQQTQALQTSLDQQIASLQLQRQQLAQRQATPATAAEPAPEPATDGEKPTPVPTRGPTAETRAETRAEEAAETRGKKR